MCSKSKSHSKEASSEESGLYEKVLSLNRCSKVVKGGRRFSFAALVVCGNRDGSVGVGYGKAKEVPDAIKKASQRAVRNMAPICTHSGTLPHPVIGHFGAGRVLLRPATEGTGVIASSGVRAILEAAGVRNILSKSLGSNNILSVVYATLEGLGRLRSKEQIYKIRKS